MLMRGAGDGCGHQLIMIAVYLSYATAAGRTFIDRALYLPKPWADDRERCTAAGIDDEVQFTTKPALAATMITRALDPGVDAPWVTGDEVYGADPRLRAERRAAGSATCWPPDATAESPPQPERSAGRAGRTAPQHVWQRLSAGAGANATTAGYWPTSTLTASGTGGY